MRGEDWWITDYQAYFNQAAATLNIDCIEEVELLCLSLQNRDKICSELHKMEHFFSPEIQRWLRGFAAEDLVAAYKFR